MNRTKRIIIIINMLLIVVVGIGIFISLSKKKHIISFDFKGNNEQTLEVNTEYVELGAKVEVDGVNLSKKIKIDCKNLNINKLGIYFIKYSFLVGKKQYIYYRKINVVDTTAPIITLTGRNTSLLLNHVYEDLGYTANDNYDGDITNKVVVTNNINNKIEGDYEVVYTVTDSNNNSTSISRVVSVKKANTIVNVPSEDDKEDLRKLNVTDYNNTITNNKFTSNGFYLEGYKKISNGTYNLKLVGNATYNFNLEKENNNNFKGNINLSNVINGDYKLHIVSENEEILLNKLDSLSKIVRSKVGDKLVTFNYTSDEVSLNISDFAYNYDILIDAGHGDNDTGASNEYMTESEMNLIISKYEKCRYEEHGLSVYMTRSDNNYGFGYGPNDIKRLYRRCYEVGYYGAVSKIIYSNHHNSIENNYFSGYEIILPGNLSLSNIDNEVTIFNKLGRIYPLTENHLRFYARDYDSEIIFSKQSGEIYNFKNYYAMNRIPYELFNVKSVIYEGSYLSNNNDFNWYWNSGNWIKVSETKIETYVKSLDKVYNSVSQNCIN